MLTLLDPDVVVRIDLGGIVVTVDGGQPATVMAFTFAAGKITAIYILTDRSQPGRGDALGRPATARKRRWQSQQPPDSSWFVWRV